MKKAARTAAGIGTVTILSACASAIACSKDGVSGMCLCSAAPKVDPASLSLAQRFEASPAPIRRASPRDTQSVHVFDFDYSTGPSGMPIMDAIIHVGDTVHWLFDEGFHTVTSVTGTPESFDSGFVPPPGTYDHTYTHVGSFVYYCEVHGFDNGDGTADGMAGVITVLAATTGSSWNVNGDGNWHTTTNWSGNTVPDGAGSVATFGTAISGPHTVTVDAPPVTVGTVNFDSSNSYLIAGTSTLNLNSGTTSSAGINVTTGSHSISAPLNVASDATFNVSSSGSTLTVSNLQDTAAALTKSGAGVLAVNHARTTATLAVNSGTVSVSSDGSDAGASKVGTLALAGGASLDLNDNDLIVGNASPAAIGALVKDARNNGAWDQPGITSSTARANAQGTTGLGVLSGAEYSSVGGTGVFSGQSYVAGDTLVKYTWNGDANLNGIVNFDDYVRVDVGFNTALTSWVNGDFNYSGSVNFDDYVLIDVAFNTQSGTLGRAVTYLSGDDRSNNGLDDPAVQKVLEHFEQFGLPYASAFLSAVPEPTSLGAGVVFALAATLAPRRKRSRRSFL